MSALNELIELDAYLYGSEDISDNGGPNTAMTVRQVLATAIPAIAELVAAIEEARIVKSPHADGGEPLNVILTSSIERIRAAVSKVAHD